MSSIKEDSFSDDTTIVQLAYGLMVATIAFVAFALYQLRKMKRDAENKVRLSDLILMKDIQILVKSNSQLLEKAIALHCAQMEPGRISDD